MMRIWLGCLLLAACGPRASPLARPPAPARPSPLESPAPHPGPPSFRFSRIEVPASVQAVATGGGMVAMLTYDNELIGVTAHGAELSRTKIRSPGSWPRLEMVGDTAIVSSSSLVIAIDTRTGNVRWRRKMGDRDTDGYNTSIFDGVVWIDSDARSMAIEARTGDEVPRVDVRPPELEVDVEYLDPDRFELYELFATDAAGQRELWRVNVVGPPATSTSHANLGDLVVFARMAGDAESIVALDTRTGATRWSLALERAGTLGGAYRGRGFTWVVLDHVLPDGGGVIHRWLAVTDTGAVAKELSAPLPEVMRCANSPKWASSEGTLAVVHAIKRPRPECAVEVVDIYAP